MHRPPLRGASVDEGASRRYSCRQIVASHGLRLVRRTGNLEAGDQLMDAMTRSLTLQLESLYEERAFLAQEIGVSDARDIVAMVRSLEAQLNDLYAQVDPSQK